MIDVLLACYNGEKYLEEQVTSILSQTLKNWELYISDDGSTDETESIIDKLELRDPRIHKLQTGIIHKCAAYHFIDMLQYSNNDYFCLCDQDDYWLPNKLSTSLSRIQELERRYGKSVPLLVFSDMKIVDENLATIAESFLVDSGKNNIKPIIEEILNTSIAAGCTMMGNGALRRLVCKTGYKPVIVMHDWWIADIAVSCGYMEKISDQLVLYRQHGNNSVGAEHYSIASKIKSFKSNAVKYWNNCRQIDYLYSNYNSYMSVIVKNKVLTYIETLNNRNLSQIYTLWRQGLLKKSLVKKISQVLTILFTKP
ncbi:glycosyltransferase family 2 protein [Bifidobacterium jacchi]|uniref:Glycosyltransferase family 2 protein n=1 Tax=Bifidobacterium jacchi TaxID=2490545 RepID=A0A5N5RCG3_9BIFI|nr:glycosyltransferase family 2 protein [Bifidobacterium jacchi]KAB5604164.1 glycosyltransferase family 2 protein [Bifidobacterium jacchi]